MKRSIAVGLLAAACATSGTFRQAEQAERRESFDEAVLLYSRAVKENPGGYQNCTTRVGLVGGFR